MENVTLYGDFLEIIIIHPFKKNSVLINDGRRKTEEGRRKREDGCIIFTLRSSVFQLSSEPNVSEPTAGL